MTAALKGPDTRYVSSTTPRNTLNNYRGSYKLVMAAKQDHETCYVSATTTETPYITPVEHQNSLCQPYEA